MAADDRRLHPLSWIFTAAQVARTFIVPILVAFFASGGSSYELWGALVLGPVAATAVLKYFVYRYRLAEDEMVVRDGVFTRTERRIPYERIQNIDLVQNPLHRVFRVALVRVETASGTRPEAVMRVLSLAAVEEMRARVFAGRRATTAASPAAVASSATANAASDVSAPAAAGTAPAPAAAHGASAAADPYAAPNVAGTLPGAVADARERVLLKLPPGELVKLGIVSNKGLVVVGAALGVLSQSGRWDTDWDELVGTWLEPAAGWLDLGSAAAWLTAARSAHPVTTALLLAIVVVVAAFVVLRVLSIGWFLLQLHDFTLTRRGPDLGADYGLLTRISRTIPTLRIQSLKATESPLHRRFRRQSVELRTVGGDASSDLDVDYNPQQGGSGAKTQWLAPMLETARVPELLRQVTPDADLSAVAWEPISERARWRIVRRWLAVVVPATLLAALAVHPWTLAVGASLALFGWLHARLYVKHAAYALTSWGILSRIGWWNRTLTIVRYGKIQTVTLGESPFDRRNGMASVRVDTAGAEAGGHTIAIPYLEAGVARRVAGRLYDEAGRRTFRWA